MDKRMGAVHKLEPSQERAFDSDMVEVDVVAEQPANEESYALRMREDNRVDMADVFAASAPAANNAPRPTGNGQRVAWLALALLVCVGTSVVVQLWPQQQIARRIEGDAAPAFRRLTQRASEPIIRALRRGDLMTSGGLLLTHPAVQAGALSFDEAQAACAREQTADVTRWRLPEARDIGRFGRQQLLAPQRYWTDTVGEDHRQRYVYDVREGNLTPLPRDLAGATVVCIANASERDGLHES